MTAAWSCEAPNARGTSPSATVDVCVNGANLVADCAGTLFWAEQRALIVADLHLEKGSSFARRGSLVPPYDTRDTLARLSLLVGRYDPRLVIALGDSFHDVDGPARLAAGDRCALEALQRGRDWVWIAGNHDPDLPADVGGTFANVVLLGALAFRHEPSQGDADGEIAGHLHPSARISRRGHAIVRRCFASDGRRMVMPAFGAFAGGLDIRHSAFVAVFGGRAINAHLLGSGRIYNFVQM